MDLTAAEKQGETFVQRAGCNGTSDVLTCLYGLSAEEVAVKTPPSWDFGGDALPAPTDTPGVLPVRDGLTIVDGVTVPRPLLDGFAVDVRNASPSPCSIYKRLDTCNPHSKVSSTSAINMSDDFDEYCASLCVSVVALTRCPTRLIGGCQVPVILQTMAAEDDINPNPRVANWTASNFTSFVKSTFKNWGDKVVSGIVNECVNISKPISCFVGGSLFFNVCTELECTALFCSAPP